MATEASLNECLGEFLVIDVVLVDLPNVDREIIMAIYGGG